MALTMTRPMTAIGAAALVSREADKLTAYRDSKGIWTIGVGITSMSGLIDVRPGLTITRQQSADLFAKASVQYAAPVDKAVKVPLADHERDALISICYNIGPTAFAGSTFVRRLNAGDRRGCAEAIMMWRKPPEIISRRVAERDQFLTPYTKAIPKARSTDARSVAVPAAKAPQSPVQPAPAPAPRPTIPSSPVEPPKPAHPSPPDSNLAWGLVVAVIIAVALFALAAGALP